MTNYAPFFIAMASVLSIGCFAQGSDHFPVKMGISHLVSDLSGGDDRVIVAYHVEERINMNFGGRITTYNVPSMNFISTIDLGPNNTRKITPIYGKAKVTALTPAELTKIEVAPVAISAPSAPVRINTVVPKGVAPKAKLESVKIDILDTYERTLEKGFQSIDMLKRVANARFFDGNLDKAARWYTELFAKTTDFEPVLYFRYAKSLEAVGETQKAKEMMKIYQAKK